MQLTHLWQPSASIDNLRQRAAFIQQIRQFFIQRNYLEVDTPVMARFGVTDVYLNNIKALFREQAYCLQTSPEFHMKRLLAAGSGPIFQLARAFRDDELGRWHNPEFTLLEWYQLGIDHYGLMDEVDALLQTILHTLPLIKITYQQAFLDTCGFDPFHVSIEALKNVLKAYQLDNVLAPDEKDKDPYLFLLMSHVIEPALSVASAPVALYHFPPSQAALAQVHNGVAERFEVYYRGVELANGFHELTDGHIQAERFAKDQLLRAQKNLPEAYPDVMFLSALENGLPPCSGVALGIDRLLALALNVSSIAEVMAFDVSRA
jgi:elongation factor P--(R)-beta-lysine ligase